MRWERICTLIVLILGVTSLSVLCLNCTPDTFLWKIGIMTALFVLLSLAECGLTIYRRYGSPLTAGCIRENQEFVSRLMKGERPSEIQVPMREQVALTRRSGRELRQYVLLQYYRALDRRDQDGMQKAIRNIEGSLPVKTSNEFYAGYYGECAFYYSFVEWNEEKAVHYFNGCPKRIAKDMDANGRRIYAYYLYYVMQDVPKALEVVSEGLAVADRFVVKGNIAIEKELLHFLKNRIEEGKIRVDMGSEQG